MEENTNVPKTAYCVKCRQKVPLNNPTSKKNSRGVSMMQGKCPNEGCNSIVNTFVKKIVPPPAQSVPAAS